MTNSPFEFGLRRSGLTSISIGTRADRSSSPTIADRRRTVDLEPGESAEVTLSWTADEEVPEGEYDLLLEVWNETDLEERLLLLDEHTEEDAFTVEKPEGTLVVSTIPSDALAIVYRDPSGRGGVPLGESPIDLPVGSYEVAVFHEDYEDVTESVTIQEGETTEVEIDLTEDELSTPVTAIRR